MSWVTPQQFASLLDAEAVGREPAGPVGAPYAGIPRKRTEEELLNDQQLRALELRRSGLTLQQCGDEMGGLSRERVRCILLGAARRWEYYNGRRPPEWEPWYSARNERSRGGDPL
jgi:hypothetical protein